jgi:DNA-binding MarR family transcriptional regulator
MRSSALQHEIRQRRPFQSEAHEAVVALMRTADLVRRQLTALVEPHGITLQQYNVLRILRGGGKDGVPTLDIAERMIEQAPGVTRLLDRLEAKELIRRRRCEMDRRQHLCWIEPKGLALLEDIDARTSRAHEDSLRGLRQKDRPALIRMLDAIRAAHR